MTLKKSKVVINRRVDKPTANIEFSRWHKDSRQGVDLRITRENEYISLSLSLAEFKLLKEKVKEV